MLWNHATDRREVAVGVVHGSPGRALQAGQWIVMGDPVTLRLLLPHSVTSRVAHGSSSSALRRRYSSGSVSRSEDISHHRPDPLQLQMHPVVALRSLHQIDQRVSTFVADLPHVVEAVRAE